ncbi:hypothetical protein PUN4_1390006 [Paraburkholderia unamae]|uniref:hypothetical protein n=1 Tax=Paraburkholderia unamae TaxID=219649 RepID=UPI001CAC1F5F|nr:hypothetical protein [Paraburkholderia unamae]CAG9249047.1 hypothetical protein PUN4_1390006 [Paraburkholderia unamae]
MPPASSKQLTIEDLQATAKARGGRGLSQASVIVLSRLECECAQGHRWESRAVNVRSGSWCPLCDSWQRRGLSNAFQREHTDPVVTAAFDAIMGMGIAESLSD